MKHANLISNFVPEALKIKMEAIPSADYQGFIETILGL